MYLSKLLHNSSLSTIIDFSISKKKVQESSLFFPTTTNAIGKMCFLYQKHPTTHLHIYHLNDDIVNKPIIVGIYLMVFMLPGFRSFIIWEKPASKHIYILGQYTCIPTSIIACFCLNLSQPKSRSSLHKYLNPIKNQRPPPHCLVK